VSWVATASLSTVESKSSAARVSILESGEQQRTADLSSLHN
jgi:hypothetical protein